MKKGNFFTLLVLLFLGSPLMGQLSVTMDGTSPTCPGFTNGIVTTSVSGGTAPYLYVWNNGFSSSSLMGVPAGTYSVAVTDANNDAVTATFTLSDPADITADITLDDVCSGNGNVTTTTTGGIAPLTYMWDDGQTVASAVGLTPGLHCLTVMDANGCAGVECITVFQELSVGVTASGLACFTSCDASVTATVMGGTGPYAYIWNTGATDPILENVPGGFYAVTVTDGNGCTTTGSTTVTAPAQLDIDVTIDQPTCGSGTTGTATVTAAGGVGPYLYFWSNNATGMTVTGLTPGTYTVTVVDANGCADTEIATVIQDGDIDINVSATPTSDCGTMDGTASATATGGTPPYTYLWNTGSVDTDISNLAPGTYTVVVTDADGCEGMASVEVTGFPAVTLTTMSVPVGCDPNELGSAIVMAFDGTPPYAYLWSTGSTMQVVDNIPEGTYTVTVTDDAGCTAVGAVEVEGTGSLDITTTPMNAPCDGSSNGSAMVSVNNGVAPYTYNWSNGDMTAMADDLSAGDYTVTVTDSEGCSAVGSVTITAIGGLDLSITVTDVPCFGEDNGIIAVVASGGTEPYAYQWSNGTVIAVNGFVEPGFYSVTVTDANGCTGEDSDVVSQPNPLSLEVTPVNGSCGGASDGSATTNVFGGTPPFTYSWSTGSTASSVSNLAAGDYSVTVTDANNCINQESFTIVSPPNLSCNIQITNPISTANGSDGEATVQIFGGTPPFDISWSNGQSGATATGLSAGSYTANITDANGCSTSCNISFLNPAKLGDRIWIDTNRDGCQDPDEGGWYNMEVTLNGTDVNGNLVVANTFTDVLGNYIFDGLVPGDYNIYITAPTGYVFTDQDACGEALDSDADKVTGISSVVNLSAGECYLDLDIGIYQKCVNVTDPGEICCDQTLCSPGNDPDPLTSLAPATGGLGNLEYIWMSTENLGPFGGGTWQVIPGANGETYDPGPLYATTYFARCVRRECCTNYVETNIITIQVETAFSAIIDGPNWVCVGDQATYSALEFGNVTYLWNFGPNATPSTSTDSEVTVTWNNWGSATITLEVTDGTCTSYDEFFVGISQGAGCGGTSNLVANTNNDGTVSLSWNAENLEPGYHFMVNRSSNGEDFEALEMVIPTANSNYHFMDEAPLEGENYYQIILENEEGNFTESNIAMAEVLNLHDLFEVYPNPFNEYVNVAIDYDVNDDVEVEIVTPYGKLINTFIIPAGVTNHELNFDGISSGIYYVRFKFGEDSKRIFKMVKE